MDLQIIIQFIGCELRMKILLPKLDFQVERVEKWQLFRHFLYFSTPGLIGDGQNLLKSWYQSYMDNLTPKIQYFGAPETEKKPKCVAEGTCTKISCFTQVLKISHCCQCQLLWSWYGFSLALNSTKHFLNFKTH